MTEPLKKTKTLSSVSPEIALQELKDKILSYFPQADLDVVQRAYEFSHKSHEGQLRRSGDPYILHPLGVASALA